MTRWLGRHDYGWSSSLQRGRAQEQGWWPLLQTCTWESEIYLRFMSPPMAKARTLESIPPGQQPHTSTAMAALGPSWNSLAREKAERGITPNWATKGIITPLGFLMWAFILETVIVQPRATMVSQRTMMQITLMAWSTMAETGLSDKVTLVKLFCLCRSRS